MAILIDNQQQNQPVAIAKVRKKAQVILDALDCHECELSIILVNDARISELNETHLHRQGPTNVIAFPMREGDYADIHPELLGDVVISMDTSAREAEGAGLPAERRLDQLLIHGILHLFGYNHIHTQEEERIMEAKSEELSALLDKAT